MGELVAGGHIRRGVANTEGTAVLLAGYVGLGIANSRLDKGSRSSLVVCADILVPGKEANDILVLLQRVHYAGVSLIERDVPFGIVGLNRRARLPKISDDINVSGGELCHAIIVVLGRVDGVYTQDVGVDLLEVWDIALAGTAIGQRVRVAGVDAGRPVWRVILLVGNTLEITEQSVRCGCGGRPGFRSTRPGATNSQLRPIVGIEEMLPIDFNVWDVVVTCGFGQPHAR